MQLSLLRTSYPYLLEPHARFLPTLKCFFTSFRTNSPFPTSHLISSCQPTLSMLNRDINREQRRKTNTSLGDWPSDRWADGRHTHFIVFKIYRKVKLTRRHGSFALISLRCIIIYQTSCDTAHNEQNSTKTTKTVRQTSLSFLYSADTTGLDFLSCLTQNKHPFLALSRSLSNVNLANTIRKLSNKLEKLPKFTFHLQIWKPRPLQS